jgi:hypothetical protein
MPLEPLEGRYSQMFQRPEAYINYWQWRARQLCSAWSESDFSLQPQVPPHLVRVVIEQAPWTVWLLRHGCETDRVDIQGERCTLTTVGPTINVTKLTPQEGLTRHELVELVRTDLRMHQVTKFRVQRIDTVTETAINPNVYLDLDDPTTRSKRRIK